MRYVSRKVIPNELLKPTTQKLYAANGTEIALLGEVELTLKLADFEVTAAVVFSEEVDDLILSIDWLVRHRCRWSFAQNLIDIDGRVIRLIKRPRRNQLRRIYAVDNTVITAGHAINVPVTMALSSLGQTSEEDWAVDPRSLGIGVLAARTLMRYEGRRWAVQVMSVGEKDFVIQQGEFIGEAEPVTAVDNGERIAKPPVGADVLSEETEVWTERRVIELDQEECRNDAHVQVVSDNLPPELDSDQQAAAKKFIHDCAELFSKSEYDIGRTSLVQHVIDTGLQRPFKQPLRRFALAHVEIIDKHVSEMLQNDIIEPAVSPWASNVVLVRKANGQLGFCVDYRQLNLHTYKDSYPLTGLAVPSRRRSLCAR